MSSQRNTPRWHYFSEEVRNWAIVAGAVFLFFSYGCPKQRLDLKIKEVDSKLKEADDRIAMATETAQIRLREYEAKAKKAEAVLNETQSSLAKIELKRRSTPSLIVRPLIEQWPSTDDVRECRLEVQLTNNGDAAITIKNIAVSVHRGRTSPVAYEAISKTQAFAQAKRIRSSPYPKPIEGDDYEARLQKWAQEIIDDHAKAGNCPHGQLFLISRESNHVEWEEIKEATRTRTADYTLTPGESVNEQFHYVITESHGNWFRFRVRVNDGTESEKVFEFNLPGLRGQDEKGEYTTAKKAQETSYKWEPSSPLLPLLEIRDNEQLKD